MTDEPPAHADRLARQRLDARVRTKPAAHPNEPLHHSRRRSDPAIAAEWEDPAGVPIDAFIFGGRRSTVVPLVHEAFNWEHGMFLGAIMASETTAAAAGAVGNLRRDPMAMLPFCGYNMGDYFAPLAQDRRSARARELPKIFYVNWFRKDEDGRFLWPGYGENCRVLAWVFRRCEGWAEAVETPIGLVPAEGAAHTDGLDVSAEDMAELLTGRSRGVAQGDQADPGPPGPVRRQASRGAQAAGRGARTAPGRVSGLAGAEAVGFGEIGVLPRQHLGQAHHDLALLPGGVVLHLAVDHVNAPAVGDRLDDLLGELDLLGIGEKTFLAMSICTGWSDQAPTQPSRKAARNWASQPSTSLMSPNGP